MQNQPDDLWPRWLQIQRLFDFRNTHADRTMGTFRRFAHNDNFFKLLPELAHLLRFSACRHGSYIVGCSGYLEEGIEEI